MIDLCPTRVLINVEGDAVPARRAKERGITWDVIFIRNDGWSLGASNELAPAAQALWPDEWIAVIKDGQIWQTVTMKKGN